MTSELYLERWRAVFGRLGAYPTTPAAALGSWRTLVDNVEGGYDWGWDEWCNDLWPRRLLDELLNDPALKGEPDVAELAARVAVEDARFRCVIQPGVQLDRSGPWWARSVLAKAGPDYVRDLRVYFAVEVAEL